MSRVFRANMSAKDKENKKKMLVITRTDSKLFQKFVVGAFFANES